MEKSKISELLEELRASVLCLGAVCSGHRPTAGALSLVNGLAGFQAAMWSALALGAHPRRAAHRPQTAAHLCVAGIASAVLAIGVVQILGRSQGFFCPVWSVGA